MIIGAVALVLVYAIVHRSIVFAEHLSLRVADEDRCFEIHRAYDKRCVYERDHEGPHYDGAHWWTDTKRPEIRSFSFPSQDELRNSAATSAPPRR